MKLLQMLQMKQQKGLSAEQNEGKTREDRQTVSQWGKSVESGNREMSMFRGRLAAAKKKEKRNDKQPPN